MLATYYSQFTIILEPYPEENKYDTNTFKDVKVDKGRSKLNPLL